MKEEIHLKEQYLNTSHVNVNQNGKLGIINLNNNLNTSHVNANP